MIQTIAFYLFAALVIASAVMVIMSRNPVHSVLWLILAFFNAAGLMVLVGAEFIAALMVIVYVGAVAVLFLFVVMMLDIDFAELRAGFIKNFPLGILSQRGRTLHRLQAVRGRLPRAGDHDRERTARGRQPPHHALRHRHDQVHLLRLLPGSLPGGCRGRGAELRIRHRNA